MTSEFDYIIVGAGAAGLVSAQYGARAGLSTLVIDASTGGGQALQIAELENYPGVFPLISGNDFSAKLKEQTLAFGAKIAQGNVQSIDKISETFIVKTLQNQYKSNAVLIATGAKHNTLGILGEKEFSGSGVSYCATCDGPFFKGKKIFVVGGGDSACSEAVYLSTLSDDVTLVHRGAKLRAQKAEQDKLFSSKVTVKFNSEISEIKGEKKVSSVLLKNCNSGEIFEEPCDAVFIFAGTRPNTDLVDFLPKDSAGYLITNEKMQTIIPGLYVAGDVRSKPFRQLVTAAADGAIAAHEAANHILELKHKS